MLIKNRNQLIQITAEEGSIYGVSLVVNDDFSISIGQQETDFNVYGMKKTLVTVHLTYEWNDYRCYAFNEVKNPAGSSTADDIELSILNLSFAF